MTAIIGILCKDGAVVGVDSSATFDNGQVRTIEQPIDKISIVGGRVIVAGSGQIGLGQRFCEIVEASWREKKFQADRIAAAKWLAKKGIEDFAETHASKGVYGALVAFPFGQTACLCEFSVTDFQPEFKTDKLWYVSMGSAQFITDTFLAFVRDVFWQNGPPTVQEAIFAATWTLQHAIAINAGGVNGPMRVAVLECGSKHILEARLLDDQELAEHQQNVSEAKLWLREFQCKHNIPDVTGLPAAPDSK